MQLVVWCSENVEKCILLILPSSVLITLHLLLYKMQFLLNSYTNVPCKFYVFYIFLFFFFIFYFILFWFVVCFCFGFYERLLHRRSVTKCAELHFIGCTLLRVCMRSIKFSMELSLCISVYFHSHQITFLAIFVFCLSWCVFFIHLLLRRRSNIAQHEWTNYIHFCTNWYHAVCVGYKFFIFVVFYFFIFSFYRSFLL